MPLAVKVELGAVLFAKIDNRPFDQPALAAVSLLTTICWIAVLPGGTCWCRSCGSITGGGKVVAGFGSCYPR